MPAVPAVDQPTAWLTEWPLWGVEFMLQAQQMQLEAWRCWQGSLQFAGNECWDWWTSHCAGGVPLDG